MRLEEIQELLHKDIEVIPIGKKDYTETLALAKGQPSLQDLMAEDEAWLKAKKRKRKSIPK